MKTVIIILCLLMSSVVYADPFDVDPFECGWWEHSQEHWGCYNNPPYFDFIASNDAVISFEDFYPIELSFESGRKIADISHKEKTITIYLKAITEEGYKLIIEEGR